MPPADEFDEIKVQKAIELLRNNPGMTKAAAARQCRAAYHRLDRRLKGIRRSSSRGGHNKKLDVPSTAALKDYLLMYHLLGRGTSIDNCVATTNSILRYNSSTGTTNRQ
jgi:hypothetical protein